MPIRNDEDSVILTTINTPLLDATRSPEYKLSPVVNKHPDTVTNALLASANDTQTLTGKAGMIHAGYPIKLVDIILNVSRLTNCRFALRAGVPPNADKGELPDFKSIYWKTKTYPGNYVESTSFPDNTLQEIHYPASFLAGTIPKQSVFRRTQEDKLPKEIPNHSCFTPLPVRLREILFYAAQAHPIYTNLRIEGDFLKFNMPHAPVASNREFIFSLNLTQKKTPAFKISDKTNMEQNEFASQEFMPWRDVTSLDIQQWRHHLQWDEEKFGPLESALDFSYLGYVQINENTEQEAIEVAATTVEPDWINSQTPINRIITGDIDICYVAMPTSITVFGKNQPLDPKFTRIYTMKDLDTASKKDEFIQAFIELYILHKNSSENRHENNPFQFQSIQYDELIKEVQAFIPSAGCITLYELLSIYLVNQEYRAAYPNFGNPIQHGGETANPGTLSSLNDTVYNIFIEKTPIISLVESIANDNHISIEQAALHYAAKINATNSTEEEKTALVVQANQEGELIFYHKILTFTENDLINMAKEATEANYYVRVHPQWITNKQFNNKEWAEIVELQLKNFPQYVDKETLESYQQYQCPVNKLRTSFNKLTSSPLFKSPTMSHLQAPRRRLSQSDEFKQGQWDILKDLKKEPPKRKNSLLRQSTNSVIDSLTERKNLNKSADSVSTSNSIIPQDNYRPDFWSLSNLRRKSLGVLDDIRGKSKFSLLSSK